jgi:excisionase family DNA binding protein
MTRPTTGRPAGDWPELMTRPEVAALFGVHPQTVTQWAKAGKLSCVRLPGGHQRFSAPSVRALLDQRGVEAAS